MVMKVSINDVAANIVSVARKGHRLRVAYNDVIRRIYPTV